MLNLPSTNGRSESLREKPEHSRSLSGFPLHRERRGKLVLHLDVPIDDFQWSNRTRNVLSQMGVQTLKQLYNADERQMMGWRGAGAEFGKEVLHCFLKLNIRPPWTRYVAQKMNVSVTNLSEQLIEEDGYGRITEGYEDNERWMLQLAIFDLERDNAVYHVSEGSNKKLFIWRKGASVKDEAE